MNMHSECQAALHKNNRRTLLLFLKTGLETVLGQTLKNRKSPLGKQCEMIRRTTLLSQTDEGSHPGSPIY